MSKPSEKKRRKEKERQRETAKRKTVNTLRRQYDEAYPRFELENRDAPEELVDLVQQTIQKIDFRNPPFGGQWADALKKGKKNHKYIHQVVEIGDIGNEVPIAFVLSCKIGQTIFDLIGEKELRRWIPHHDIQFMLTGSRIMVLFRSLMTAQGKGGTTYYSRRKPKIEVDGKEYIIGFPATLLNGFVKELSPIGILMPI